MGLDYDSEKMNKQHMDARWWAQSTTSAVNVLLSWKKKVILHFHFNREWKDDAGLMNL